MGRNTPHATSGDRCERTDRGAFFTSSARLSPPQTVRTADPGTRPGWGASGPRGGNFAYDLSRPPGTRIPRRVWKIQFTLEKHRGPWLNFNDVRGREDDTYFICISFLPRTSGQPAATRPLFPGQDGRKRSGTLMQSHPGLLPSNPGRSTSGNGNGRGKRTGAVDEPA